MIPKFPSRFNDWLWGRVVRSVRVDADSLCAFRWFFGIFVLVVLTPRFAWIGEVPRAFFLPPLLSVANLFAGFPPPTFFKVLEVATIISLGLVTIGCDTRTSSVMFLLCDLVGKSFASSFGKNDNNAIIDFVVLAMLFSDWGAKWSIDSLYQNAPPKQEKSSRALSLLAVILAFGMVTAGFEKAIKWIDFDTNTSGVVWWWSMVTSDLGYHHFLAGPATNVPLPYWEPADYAAPAFELTGFLALLVSRRAWLTWLAVACVFHWGNVLLLNIPFLAHVPIYLAFANWNWLGRFIRLKAAAWLVAAIVVMQLALPRPAWDTILEFHLWIGLIGWPVACMALWR